MRRDPLTYSLFEPARPPVPGPRPPRRLDTTRAAKAAVQDLAPQQRRRICDAILQAGPRGLTRNELHRLTGISIQSLCFRLHELEGRAKNGWGLPKFQPSIRMDTAVTRDRCHPYVALDQGAV